MKKTKKKEAALQKASEIKAESAPGYFKRFLISHWFPPMLLLALVAVYYWPVISLKGFLWNDFIEQNFPYRLFAAVSLKQGVFPFWTPYVFSGMPFFADVQAAVLYPLNLLLTFLASNDWLSPIAVEYQVIFHVFLAGIFMYLLAREFTCNKPGSVLSAITFMFCGFFTAHVFHVNLIHTAAWFPLIILFFTRALKKRSLIYAALTALVLCIVFFCGYPQLMLHIYYWMAAYYLFLLIVNIKKGTTVKTEVSRGALFGIIVALGLGMSAVQLLPTNELGQNSVRPKLEFSESCEGSLRPYRLITMIAPNYFGRPDKETYWGISRDDFNSGVHYYWETAIYTGIAPLILAFIAAVFVRTPLSLFLSLMGILSLMLAMGDSFILYGLFYHILPGLKSFRVPGRFAFMFTISVSLLAGFGLQWLQNRCWMEKKEKSGRTLRVVGCASLLCIAAALFASLGALREGVISFLLNSGHFGSDAGNLGRFVDERVYPQIISSLWMCAFLSTAAALMLFLVMRDKLKAAPAGVLFCTFVMIDYLAFGYGFAAINNDPRLIYMKTPAIEDIQRMQNQEFFRINSRDSRPGTDDLGGSHMAFNKNQGNVQRLFLMEGYNPLRLKRQLVNRKEKTLDILNIKYALQVDEQKRSMGFVERNGFCPRCRMVYDYKVENDENKILPDFYSDSFNHKTGVILEEKPCFEASTEIIADSSWNCRIVSYSLNSITIDVQTPRTGLLTLSEIYYPEWKAKVDGAGVPLYRADYALRAIPVTPGHHNVTCYYDPETFRKGLHISLVALALTIALGFTGFAIQRKKPL